MITFKKYQKNLKYDDNFIYSYGTIVAEYQEGKLYPLEWEIMYKDKSVTSSPTTSKHINYASKELELEIINKCS